MATAFPLKGDTENVVTKILQKRYVLRVSAGNDGEYVTKSLTTEKEG
jgi:hypothetical protein